LVNDFERRGQALPARWSTNGSVFTSLMKAVLARLVTVAGFLQEPVQATIHERASLTSQVHP